MKSLLIGLSTICLTFAASAGAAELNCFEREWMVGATGAKVSLAQASTYLKTVPVLEVKEGKDFIVISYKPSGKLDKPTMAKDLQVLKQVFESLKASGVTISCNSLLGM